MSMTEFDVRGAHCDWRKRFAWFPTRVGRNTKTGRSYHVWFKSYEEYRPKPTKLLGASAINFAAIKRRPITALENVSEIYAHELPNWLFDRI